MKKNILLVNIGNSDVDLDGNKAYKKGEPRVIGKEIVDNWEQYKNRVDIPIIKAIMEGLKTEIENVDEIYLFCSDQDEDVDIQYRNKDTLYFAEIVKKKLIEMNFNESNIKIKTIRGNIASYDKMYKYFKEFFNENIENFKDNYIFCSVTGGTPASNTTLFINCVEYLGINSKVVYVEDKSPKAKLLEISHYYLINNVLKIFKEEFLKHYYQGAKIIAEEYKGIVSGFNNIINLVESANDILNFNFKDALEKIKQFYNLKIDIAINQKIERFIEKIENLYKAQRLIKDYKEAHNIKLNEDVKLSDNEVDELKNAYEQLLGFIVERIKVSLKHKNEFEFLDLLFGFYENLLKYLVTKHIKVPIFKKYFEAVRNELLKDEKFKEKCKNDNNKDDSEKINLNGEINTYILRIYLETAIERFSNDEKKVINPYCKILWDLKEFRNEVVHNFGKADLEELNSQIQNNNKLKQDNIQSIEELFERIIQLSGISQTNILNEIQDIVEMYFKDKSIILI